MIQVLIAEDDALMRMGIRFCLDQENSEYELVGEAENGRQALEMCLKYKPQILITDIKMPMMDGIELIRQIKARKLDIKIIILTCYEEFSYLHEAMHLGVDDYLLKVGMKPERLREVLDGIRDKYYLTEGESLMAPGESRLDALESIVMGYIGEPDEVERLRQVHHLDLDFNRYAVLLIEAEDDENLTSQRKLESIMRRSSSLQDNSAELVRLSDDIAQRFGSISVTQSNALILQIAGYVGEHYGENLTLDHISRKFGINTTYFCKLFKRVVGKTFVEFLTDRRIQVAMRLIRTTDLPNYAIARQTGFQNPEYFSKIFKKQTGMTPKEYKRKAGTDGRKL